MAFKDESYHSLSMLNGVPVKVGDKFKRPTKISLPIGWIPSDPSELLSFQYDFAKEQEVIQLADNERLLKEQQELENVEKLMQSTPQPEPDNAEGFDENTNQANNEEDATGNSTHLPNPPFTTHEDEMLLPSVVPATASTSMPNMTTTRSIDLEEFESTNQNPFELVELQTLNELDELRSVLEPQPKTNKKVIKSTPPQIDSGQEIDFSIFNTAPLQQTITTSSAVATCNTLIDTGQYMTNPPPPVSSAGTLTWTKFDENASNVPLITNPFQPYSFSNSNDISRFQNIMPNENIISAGSHVYPRPAEIVQDLTDQSINPINSGSLTRTKSLPNLQESSDNDYENVESFTRQRNPSGGLSSVSFNKSTEELHALQQPEGNVPTDRINNIMKQFQFQRYDYTTPNMQPQQSDLNTTSLASGPMVSNIDPSTMNGERPMLTNESRNNGTTQEFYNPAMSSISTNNMQPVPNTSYTSSDISYQNYNPNQSQSGYVAPYMSTNPFRKNDHVPSSIPLSVPSSSIPVTSPSWSLQTSQYAPTNEIQTLSGPMLIQSKPSQFSTASEISISSSRPYENVQFPRHTSPQQKLPYTGNGVVRPREKVFAVNSFSSGRNDESMPTDISHLSYPNMKAMPMVSSSQVPNISPSMKTVPSAVQQTTVPVQKSWLTDETQTLSTSEKNFAFQLNAMGFDIPTVSRAIKRLGKDEKEVLDFLCLVQDLKEQGYNADDAEIALVNNKNDKEKTIDYLKMVTVFQELGFPPKNIHVALKETSCDQNKALDYLVRAGS